MLFALEQALLAFVALAIWNCVVGNALSIDIHFRGGLGLILIGLAYVAAHDIYLKALEQPAPKPSANAPLIVPLPMRERQKADAEKAERKSSNSQSSEPRQQVSSGTDSPAVVMAVDPSYFDDRVIVIEPAHDPGYAGAPLAANAPFPESGNGNFAQIGTTVGATAQAALAMAAGAHAGGGHPLTVRVIHSGTPGSSYDPFGPEPRTLRDAQIQNAIRLLKTKPGQQVLIITMRGEGDGPEVAEQLIEIFSKAGWEVFGETSETRFLNGNNIEHGVRFVAPDREHESVRIAWDAFKDTPVMPASILPLRWSARTAGSEQVRLGPPLTIVIGTP